MKAIYKYALKRPEVDMLRGGTLMFSELGVEPLELPRGALVLSLQVQRDVPCLWVLTNISPAVDMEQHELKIYETGRILHEGFPRHFLGTFQLFGGDIVFHVFSETLARHP